MPNMPQERSRRVLSRGHRRTHSCTAQVKLQFLVNHMECLLRVGHYTQHLSLSTAAFLEAITQYMMAKVLELACNETQNSGRRCIITRELVDMAVCNNPLLSSFFGTTTISQVAPARE
ncbi:Histone H2A-Bbd type 2/3 [Manis javanica]|nr:Histone H2A-Bbd type 2/3 [Manis javanica]